MKRLLLMFLVVTTSIASATAASVCSKSSPAHTIALLELYSSEGCSSCPPADNLIRQLYQVTGLTSEQVIPLALHVDYWDYLGWKDPYAKANHTERQRYLSSLAGSKTIYTPEFFMAGQEFRPGRVDLRHAVETINQQAALATIHIELGRIKGNQVAMQIDADANQVAQLQYVLVEQGISGKVNAGENSGETLQHDAVVREWGAPVALFPHALSKNKVQLTLPANPAIKNLSVVAFVQNAQGKILQALSMPMCTQVSE
jgi:hypothetical protein